METLKTLDVRHLAILITAAAVAAVGGVIFLMGDSASSDASARGAATTFGLGRDVVRTIPGAEVSGSLQTPDGASPDQVRWQVTSDRGDLNTTGRGPEFSFTAPASGRVTLVGNVPLKGKTVRASTSFVIDDATTYSAIGVTSSGRVLVNGGRAVRGEALPTGTKVDATKGEIRMTARATTRGLQGELRFSGSSFTLKSEVLGDKVLNTIAVQRDAHGGTNRLDAEAETLDGSRYVKNETPDAVAMVKGTRYTIVVGPERSTVEVEEGLVGVYDRFRYYVAEKQVGSGQSADVDALDIATMAMLTEAALQTGSSQVISQLPDGGTIGTENLARRDTLVRQLLQEDVRISTPVNPQGTPPGERQPLSPETKADGDSPATSEPGTTTTPESTTTDNSTTTTTETNQTDSRTAPYQGTQPDNNTTTSPSTSVKQPPAGEPYVRGSYGGRACEATHIQWSEAAPASGGLLCWPRNDLPKVYTENYGYQPLKWNAVDWGCSGRHSVWNPDVWCMPVTPTALGSWPMPYEAPKGRKRDGTIVSMGCRPGHFAWTDGKCHAAAQ